MKLTSLAKRVQKLEGPSEEAYHFEPDVQAEIAQILDRVRERAAAGIDPEPHVLGLDEVTP